MAIRTVIWLRFPVVFHYRKDARTKGPCGSIVKGDWKLIEFFRTPHIRIVQGFLRIVHCQCEATSLRSVKDRD